jgi:hypothetical protein
MQRKKPPFRADHVGSLLRPTALKQARAKREQGEVRHDLEQIEDREIEKAIRKLAVADVADPPDDSSVVQLEPGQCNEKNRPSVPTMWAACCALLR